LIVKRGHVAKGLIEQRFQCGSAPMCAAKPALAFEHVEIAPRRRDGDAKPFTHFINADCSGAQELLENELTPLTGRESPTRHVV